MKGRQQPPSEEWLRQEDLSGTAISFDDYQRAFFNYRDCLKRAGYSFPEFHLEPVLQLYEWDVTEEVASDAHAQACYEKHLEEVDLRWQTQRQHELAPLWERRRQHIVECLLARGVDVPSGLSYPAVVELASVAGHSECVVSAPWTDDSRD